jgi:3-methyladenine DNA glycosylase AlkD
VIRLGVELLDHEPWGRLTGYELIAHHPGGLAALTPASIRRLARGLDDWVGVDTFACYLAGPSWREGRLPTSQVHLWLQSSDRWQRRAAVVCTVALNVRARGGRGDSARTLAVCRRVVRDRDDMVVKALSWALRSLVEWDRDAVRGFLAEHQDSLSTRVKREVGTKLRTGRKH